MKWTEEEYARILALRAAGWSFGGDATANGVILMDWRKGDAVRFVSGQTVAECLDEVERMEREGFGPTRLVAFGLPIKEGRA